MAVPIIAKFRYGYGRTADSNFKITLEFSGLYFGHSTADIEGTPLFYEVLRGTRTTVLPSPPPSPVFAYGESESKW